ncbi:MAG: Txe/YoeB family addiction module toxin [Actinomyces ruminicola]|uniref:Endoribonuclease YoeB n=1 Tax=Actinomyces ruminicola TaxID=332524 RepID=A0A1G9UP89_9ACTO|nr:Txe/YoeB family addiction module toxin [Actinomyces ruminicola]MBE6482125.1 Txe/YoeB family addiction module toxin [Actinomyces ruminicola]SDM61647.1 toxin YoeB [Actinomyces ruminicola]SDN62989.1 toxin YoeB [Actinomyces ruminicola]
MRLIWSTHARQDYLWWQTEDRRVLERVNLLLQDTQRHGNEGLGKPEALRGNLSGYWSRRITAEHRLVYRVDGDDILIVACRLHYGR